MAMETAQIEDLKWIGEHYSELQRKYPDMYIAVKDGKVIAVGRKFGEVYNKAKKLAGEKNFAIDYMLTWPLSTKHSLITDFKNMIFSLDF